MKNKIKRLNIILFLLVIIFKVTNVSALEIVSNKDKTVYNYDYYINKYNIDINVNENNTFDITENISVIFDTEKHGIYRKIPIKNYISRTDKSSSSNITRLTNLKVSDKYKLTKEEGNYFIKIGDPDETLTGKKNYTIKYTYNIGKDPLKDKDEFYFNIIGTQWDTIIKNVNFTIKMPKSFDKTKIGFSHGLKGSTNSDSIKYSVKNNTIKGTYENTLSPNEALTIRLELPNNYFKNASIFDPIIILIFLIPLLFTIISYLIWNKYGKDKKVVETIEFYPPDNLNSLEAAYIYKGKVNSKDVVSLLIYLANKGYLKISKLKDGESKEKDYDYGEHNHLKKESTYKIIELKKYDGTNKKEKVFLEGIFLNSKLNSSNQREVLENDLKRDFYYTIRNLIESMEYGDTYNLIYENNTSRKSFLILLLSIISINLAVFIPTYNYIGQDDITILLSILFFIILAFTLIIRIIYNKILKVLLGMLTIAISYLLVSSTILYKVFENDKISIIGFIFAFITMIIMQILSKNMEKMTPYGIETLGKLKGFKTFIETSSKDKLESLVNENPTYFYDILPYAYVFKISNSWIKKFESISQIPPTWYDSLDSFDFNSFNSSLIDTLNSTRSTDGLSHGSSDSSSSSSSNSSGGGSSGGGSGGGGGGSW